MKKNSSKSLQTLSRIKGREEREAAAHLTTARERLDRERKNLTTVQAYLEEYSNSTASGGMHSRLLAEGYRFRRRLEQSLEAQQRAVDSAQRQAEAARAHWSAVRSEREAMNKLIDRRREEDQQNERNGEQKQTDEQSLQQSARRSQGAA